MSDQSVAVATGYYTPRHARWASGFSALERARVDQERAARAVVVLAATEQLEASRVLYRELLRAGALHPALAVAS